MKLLLRLHATASDETRQLEKGPCPTWQLLGQYERRCKLGLQDVLHLQLLHGPVLLHAQHTHCYLLVRCRGPVGAEAASSHSCLPAHTEVAAVCCCLLSTVCCCRLRAAGWSAR